MHGRRTAYAPHPRRTPGIAPRTRRGRRWFRAAPRPPRLVGNVIAVGAASAVGAVSIGAEIVCPRNIGPRDIGPRYVRKIVEKIVDTLGA